MNTCRPDIAHAVIKLAAWSSNPTLEALNESKRVLKYLYCSREQKLTFYGGKVQQILGFSDSDWAGDFGRSTVSTFIFVSGGAYEWKTTTLKNYCTSVQEAETYAMAQLVQRIIYLRQVIVFLKLEEIFLKIPPYVYSDNMGVITSLCKRDGDSAKSRHYLARLGWLKQALTNGKLILKKIHTKDNLADLNTKWMGKSEYMTKSAAVMSGPVGGGYYGSSNNKVKCCPERFLKRSKI